jgi:long-subunit acyl-CoA synthetase (AMP-forming)
VVAGEGKSGLSALLVAADGFNAMAVAASVTEVNMRLSVTERVRKHVLVQAFTVDNGLLTATHKVRRHAVIARFGGLLEG